MILRGIHRFLQVPVANGERPPLRDQPRPRLELGPECRLIYAVGDIHGRFDLLLAMEERIAEDARSMDLPATVILLGDYVDRGPSSAAVLDYLTGQPKPWITRHCLAGNHEQMMLSFLNDPNPHDPWLSTGGRETLMSYGWQGGSNQTKRQFREFVSANVPREHIEFLRSLPVLIQSPHHWFVHAGMRPDLPPEAQSDTELMWSRDGMASDYAGAEKTIVHGHQVVGEPLVAPHRVNLDIGAFATGRLAAARFMDDDPPQLLEVRSGRAD